MQPQKSRLPGLRRQRLTAAAGAAPTRLEQRHLKKQQQRLEVERVQEVQEKGPSHRKKSRRSELRPQPNVKSRKQRRAATSEVNRVSNTLHSPAGCFHASRSSDVAVCKIALP